MSVRPTRGSIKAAPRGMERWGMKATHQGIHFVVLLSSDVGLISRGATFATAYGSLAIVTVSGHKL